MEKRFAEQRENTTTDSIGGCRFLSVVLSKRESSYGSVSGMSFYRKTAIVQFELPSGAEEGSLPLTCEREFGVILTIEGRTYPAQSFQSPINDEQWRRFKQQLSDCNVNRNVQTGIGVRRRFGR